jgi:hypothetical protein
LCRGRPSPLRQERLFRATLPAFPLRYIAAFFLLPCPRTVFVFCVLLSSEPDLTRVCDTATQQMARDLSQICGKYQQLIQKHDHGLDLNIYLNMLMSTSSSLVYNLTFAPEETTPESTLVILSNVLLPVVERSLNRIFDKRGVTTGGDNVKGYIKMYKDKEFKKLKDWYVRFKHLLPSGTARRTFFCKLVSRIRSQGSRISSSWSHVLIPRNMLMSPMKHLALYSVELPMSDAEYKSVNLKRRQLGKYDLPTFFTTDAPKLCYQVTQHTAAVLGILAKSAETPI